MVSLYLAFIIYMLVLTLIGFIFSYQSSTASEYVSGHRSINYVVTAIATQASDMGSWLFMGLPAAVFATGMPEAWTAIGLVLGMLSTWILIAKKLRVESEKLSAETLNQYFIKKHPSRYNTALLCIAALTSTFFFTAYILAGWVSLGRLLQSAIELPYETGILISLLVTLVYTLIGGFISVAWCDFFQGMFLLIMIVLVPLQAIKMLGGITATLAKLEFAHISTSLFGTDNFLHPLILSLGWGLGYFGQPHILSNFFGIQDEKKVTSAAAIGISWQIIVFSASVVIGLVGKALYLHNATFNPEFTFVTMAFDTLPPLMAGFAICGILAATLSSLDSLILVGGTTLAYDCYKSIINPKISPIRTKNLARIGSLALAVLAAGIALITKGTIYNLVNFAWAGLGATFGPPLLFSLYWKRTNALGICLGMIVGTASVLLASFFALPVLPLVPAFFASTITIILVGLFGPSEEEPFAKTNQS